MSHYQIKYYIIISTGCTIKEEKDELKLLNSVNFKKKIARSLRLGGVVAPTPRRAFP